MSKKAIVIGSGIAGLASSIRLAKKGFETHVFEANDFPGGKINSKTIDGYRFDQGPSIFTCPEYIQELYELCGKDFSEFESVDLDESYKYFFNDGTTINIRRDRESVVQEFSTKLAEPREQIEKYLDKAELNYKLISPLFIEKSLHRWWGLFGKKLVKALAKLPSYKLLSTMNQENKRFFKNPRTVQIFNRFAQYNGSHPYKAPAMLNMISHLELNRRPFVPKNGMIQVTDSLYQLALDQGVHFHLGEKVEAIQTSDSRIKGITTTKGSYDCDFVISNMDVAYSYEQLLPAIKRPKKILAQEKSSSVLAFYWGIKKEFRELNLHNMIFSDTDREEFDAVFEEKTMHDEPTIYIYISSKATPSDAPEGCENWFVLLNAPINEQQDWDEELTKKRRYILDKLNRLLGEDIEPLIACEESLDPRVIESKYLGKQGSIYGNASNNRFAAFYRHPNYSNKVKGLYFAGVSVHPGGGIPLALNSAKIAVKCLCDDHQIA